MVQFSHSLFRIPEPHAMYGDSKTFTDILNYGPRRSPVCCEGDAAHFDKRHIHEENTASYAKDYRFAKVKAAVSEQCAYCAAFTMGCMTVNKWFTHDMPGLDCWFVSAGGLCIMSPH